MANDQPAFMQIPEGMVVSLMPCRFAVNASDEHVWLWLRYPSHVISQGFEPQAAIGLGRALMERGDHLLRELQSKSKLSLVERPDLLGPDGRPVQ